MNVYDPAVAGRKKRIFREGNRRQRDDCAYPETNPSGTVGYQKMILIYFVF